MLGSAAASEAQSAAQAFEQSLKAARSAAGAQNVPGALLLLPPLNYHYTLPAPSLLSPAAERLDQPRACESAVSVGSGFFGSSNVRIISRLALAMPESGNS